MKTNFVKTISVLFLVLSVVTGCKKDEKPSKQYQAPSIASDYQIVQVPTQLTSSSDYNAQMAGTYMAMANAFAGYSAYFNVPSNAAQSVTKSSGTVYTWSYGGTTVKLTYDEDASYRYWVWYINDVKFMDCKESLLATSGSFNVYDYENGGAAVIVYAWNKTGSAVNATLKLIGSSESYFFKINSSLDGKTGTFDLYEGTSESGIHIVNVTWTLTGGTWWISYGGETYSGSWTN
jgi:hypothetical protein